MQVYSTENNRITAKERVKFVKQDPKLKIMDVPKMVEKIVNVFFYDPEQVKEQGEMFSLYKCQVTQEGAEFKATPLFDVYKIDTNFFEVMKLHNYDKETFIINLITQVLVIKRHYPIDTGELKYRHENSRLVYL